MSEPVRVPDADVAFCRRHFHELIPEGHPSGVTWQARYVIAAGELAQLAIADERIMRRAGWDPETATTADASQLSLLLAEASPLCCFITPAAFGTLRERIVAKVALVVRGRLREEGPPA